MFRLTDWFHVHLFLFIKAINQLLELPILLGLIAVVIDIIETREALFPHWTLVSIGIQNTLCKKRAGEML